MHLLVVEDDPVIADHIVSGLSAFGHSATLARTGSGAIQALADAPPDAMILDRMLPDMDGVSIIRQMRGAHQAVPVLMLSALGSVKHRIEGLQIGADDYLAKPFDIDELAARLQAIVRRRGARADEPILNVGMLRLDPSSHRAMFRDKAVVLNRKQFSLLAHLMRNADRLVTRSMLIEQVWSYAFSPSTNIIESNMSRLRTALQEMSCDPIETQRGAGYVLRSDRCR